MAKKKGDEGTSLFGELAKSVGGETLEEMDKDLLAGGFIDTGVLALNYACSGKFVGGGYPIGAAVELYGESSSGKSLLGTNAIKGCQAADGIPVFLDAERTISKNFAVKASKVDPKKMIVMWGDTITACFNKIFKIMRQTRTEAKIAMTRPMLIVYDSIAASPSEREFAETTLDMEESTKAQIKAAGAGADMPGERAKTCGKELRKLNPILKENRTTVVFINQVRNAIGVMYGDPEVTAGGGKALPFYCSLRFRLSARKQIKIGEKVVGVNVNVKNKKNKCFRPFVEVTGLRLFFDQGIDPFGGLLDLLLMEGRVESTGSPGFYKVCEPYAGGREITFRAKKDDNLVPVDVLLDCPALVDAASADEVKYYVDTFGAAVAASSGPLNEVDVSEEQ